MTHYPSCFRPFNSNGWWSAAGCVRSTLLCGLVSYSRILVWCTSAFGHCQWASRYGRKFIPFTDFSQLYPVWAVHYHLLDSCWWCSTIGFDVCRPRGLLEAAYRWAFVVLGSGISCSVLNFGWSLQLAMLSRWRRRVQGSAIVIWCMLLRSAYLSQTLTTKGDQHKRAEQHGNAFLVLLGVVALFLALLNFFHLLVSSVPYLGITG